VIGLRDADRRIKKYRAKVDGDISQLRLERYKKTQNQIFKTAMPKQVEIENQVKNYMAHMGISPMLSNYYILFAKNMLKNTPQECDIEFNKWAGRNLDWYHLRNIGRSIFHRRLNLWNVDREPECVMYLPFSEGQGAKTFDKSGNGNNGTLNLPTWTDGVLGNGLLFDGIDDYVNVPNSPELNVIGDMSICAWVNYSSTQTKTWPAIVNKGQSGVGGYLFYIAEVQHSFTLQLIDALGSSNHTSNNNVIVDDVWMFICAVKSAATGRVHLYVNGIQNVTRVILREQTASTVPLRIGIGEQLHGLIDEVRIFDRALTATEILNMYNAEKPYHF
jgi:hypothetical protein